VTFFYGPRVHRRQFCCCGSAASYRSPCSWRRAHRLTRLWTLNRMKRRRQVKSCSRRLTDDEWRSTVSVSTSGLTTVHHSNN